MINIPTREDFEFYECTNTRAQLASLDINLEIHPEYIDFVDWLEYHNNCEYDGCDCHEFVHEGIPLTTVHSGFIGVIVEERYLDRLLDISQKLLSTRLLDV